MNEILDLLHHWAQLQPEYCWGRGHCLYLKDHHGRARIIAGIQDICPDMVLGSVLRAIAAEDLRYHLERVDGGVHIFSVYLWEAEMGYMADLAEVTHQDPAIAALTAWVNVLHARQSAEVA